MPLFLELLEELVLPHASMELKRWAKLCMYMRVDVEEVNN